MLSCPHCTVGIKGNIGNRKLLDILSFNNILEKVAPTAMVMQLYFQGEPTLNKQLYYFIEKAKQAGLYTIVSTNAQLIDRAEADKIVGAGLDKIIVSLDGATQQTYEQYRKGGSITKVFSALQYLNEAKKNIGGHTRIVLQCLRLKSNEGEWSWLQKNYKALGADSIEMKTAQFYDYENGQELMPTDERYSRYKRVEEHYVRKKRYRNRCWRLWSGCVVNVDSDVLPCCFDKNSRYSFGNLKSSDIKEVWHSVAAKRFRKQVLRDRKGIDICLNCTE